jgi:hypothetical protein
MHKPTQLHFGGHDTHKGFSDPETANELEELLKQSKSNYEFYRYPDQGHGKLVIQLCMIYTYVTFVLPVRCSVSVVV